MTEIIFWKLTPVGLIICKYFLPGHIFLFISFAVQNLLSFISPHFFILLLFLLPWKTDLRKHDYNLCQRMFCLCYRLSFMISRLIFKSFSHFEFIFVCGVRVCSNMRLSNFSSTTCWRDHLFPSVYCCLLYRRFIDGRCVGLFVFLSIDLYVCFCAGTILFWLLQLCSQIQSLGNLCLQLCSFSSRLLWQFGV